MKIIIIGGGASGLVCAINAKNNHNEVTILEQNDKLGKKIIASGAGHCNYFNKDFNLDKYHSSNIDLLGEIINDNNISKVIPFFQTIGIEPKNKNGYLYPMAYTSYSILNSLVLKCKELNIDICTNTYVKGLKMDKNTFIIETNNKVYNADKVIIACGSKAYPSLGGTNSAIDIAKSFGIKYQEFLPSLTGLHTDNKVTKYWDKLRCDVKLSYFEDEKYVSSEEGEIQLTSYGISGICTFNLSSNIVKNINKHNEVIKIDFIPDIDRDFLTKRINEFSNLKVVEIFEGLLNYKIILALFHNNDKLINKYGKELNNSDINTIIDTIKSFTITITGYNDFDNSQVASGGILLSEINTNTFETNKVHGLFFIGESLDVDGICGGYNLGFAWISGILCGKYINNTL